MINKVGGNIVWGRTEDGVIGIKLGMSLVLDIVLVDPEFTAEAYYMEFNGQHKWLETVMLTDELFGFVLYGFQVPASAQLFKKLLSVKGVGPATASRILQAYTYENMYFMENRAKELIKVRGIGAATAECIVEALDRG